MDRLFRRPELWMVLRLLRERHRLMIPWLLTTFAAALTEGIGIGMLLPFLDAINVDSGAFSEVPLLSQVLALFGDLPLSLRIVYAGLGLIALALVRSALNFASQYIAHKIRIQIDLDLRHRAMTSAVELDYQRAVEMGSPVLYSNVMSFTSATAAAAMLIANSVSQIASVLVYLTMCLLLSPLLTFAAVALLIPAMLLLRWLLLGRLGDLGEASRLSQIRLHRVSLGLLYGIRTVRVSALERWQLGRFKDHLDVHAGLELQEQLLKSAISPTFQLVVTVTVASLLAGSALVRTEGVVAAIPMLILFLFVLMRMASPLEGLNSARLSLESMLPSVAALFSFFEDSERWLERKGGAAPPVLDEAVEFSRVCFAYNDGKPVLSDVDFSIPSRKMTALVGPFGAGKSTLIGILTGLLTPQQGQVLIDGVPLTGIDTKAWRRKLAVVSQDAYIFDDTIESNVRLGREELAEEELRDGLEAAQAMQFIDALESGADTWIGEQGSRLSGGQRQRVVLARALVDIPSLLVLDEATSSLDAETEHAVQQAIASLHGQRTLLVIAHRLSTVRRADQIIVMKEGSVVERGTHTSLLKLGGLYARMVQLQMLDDDPTDTESDVANLAGAIR